MAADRGIYIDQSQSLNIHMVDATTAKLSSMHFHGWQLGLKTGMYYLRTKAAVDAIKFTVDVSHTNKATASSASAAPAAAAAGKGYPAAGAAAAPGGDAMQAAIDRLKAQEVQPACLNCSA